MEINGNGSLSTIVHGLPVQYGPCDLLRLSYTSSYSPILPDEGTLQSESTQPLANVRVPLVDVKSAGVLASRELGVVHRHWLAGGAGSKPKVASRFPRPFQYRPRPTDRPESSRQCHATEA